MTQPRPPLAERPSAVNLSLWRSLADDGGDREGTIHVATQPGISAHEGKNDYYADILGKKNTTQQPSGSLNAANLSHQASGCIQTLHCSLTTDHSYELPDPLSYEAASPVADLPTLPLSSRSSSLSPRSPLSEQVELPDLSESNDDLWKEVMASQRSATGLYAPTQSSMKSIDPLSMVLATNTPMFKWRVNEGRITELDYKLHWLNSLQPKDIFEKNRICELAVNGLQQLRVLPLPGGIGAYFRRLSYLADLRWRHSLFQNLFPFGSETGSESPSLFALLGDNDLHRLQLPSKSPVVCPPDLVYSMTAEIFPMQYREDLKSLLFEKKDYAAPYLTVFLTNRRYGELTERMKLWGVHMLDARVAEWCRALYPTRELTDKPPTKLPLPARTTMSSVSRARKSDTSRSSNVSTFAKLEPEVDKRLEGAPCHYSIALKHAQYSIWKFEADLRMTSNGIERRGVKCTQFKENSALLTDMQWEELASNLVGIHLDAANQTGIFVKAAIMWMRPARTVGEGGSESGVGEGWGNGGWPDEDHWEEDPRENWTSALNEE